MRKIKINLRHNLRQKNAMKLPKPRKRGDAYRIEIMLDGKRYSATRDTAKECEQWASLKVLEHKAGLAKDDKTHTISMSELMTLYHDKVGQYKPSAKNETLYRRSFIRNFDWLAQMPVGEITAKELTDWRNARLVNVSAGTVLREISYLSAVMTYAVKELFIITENPFAKLAKPSMPKPRNRRISDDDVAVILATANYTLGETPTTTQHYVAWCFLFAIHTAMRRGEILGVKMADIKDGYIHLPKTKNGDSRNVPLTPYAKQMLSWVNHDGDKLVPISETNFRQVWTSIQKRSKLDNLTYHDTRHEAISRFVKDLGLPVETLAKVTGHKDIKTLVNTYYNPTIDELVGLFNK